MDWAKKLDRTSGGELNALTETGNKKVLDRLSVAVKEAKIAELRPQRWFEEVL